MAKVKRKKTAKKKVARKKVARKKPVTRRRKPVKRKIVTRSKTPKKRARSAKRKVVKTIERASVERVVAGKKRARKRRKKRPVVMAGSRRRSVGKKGNSNLLLALGIGAAVYFLTKKPTPTYPPGYSQLPPLAQTNNYQRNEQTSSVLNYALAAGLAFDAITKLIDRLNSSDDTQVKQIYDNVATTGDVGVYV